MYALVGPGVAMLSRFIAGSMAFLGLFRVVEAIAAESPADAVQDLASWLNYLTSVDARRGPDVSHAQVGRSQLQPPCRIHLRAVDPRDRVGR